VTATKAGDAADAATTSAPTAVRERAAAPQRAFDVVGNFVTGSPVLTTSMKQRLQKLALVVARRHFTSVVIRGYSSITGNLGANETLSQQRASAADAYFVAQLAADHVAGVTVTYTGAGLGRRPVLVDNQMVTLTCHS
jgi:outer membrane protein OmpA-like peptidoglycan-associated protein